MHEAALLRVEKQGRIQELEDEVRSIHSRSAEQVMILAHSAEQVMILSAPSVQNAAVAENRS